jgi:hypothetical protein
VKDLPGRPGEGWMTERRFGFYRTKVSTIPLSCRLPLAACRLPLAACRLPLAGDGHTVCRKVASISRMILPMRFR